MRVSKSDLWSVSFAPTQTIQRIHLGPVMCRRLRPCRQFSFVLPSLSWPELHFLRIKKEGGRGGDAINVMSCGITGQIKRPSSSSHFHLPLLSCLFPRTLSPIPSFPLVLLYFQARISSNIFSLPSSLWNNPRWGTADAELKVFSTVKLEQSKVFALKRGAGQNITLHVSPTSKNLRF